MRTLAENQLAVCTLANQCDIVHEIIRYKYISKLFVSQKLIPVCWIQLKLSKTVQKIHYYIKIITAAKYQIGQFERLFSIYSIYDSNEDIVMILTGWKAQIWRWHFQQSNLCCCLLSFILPFFMAFCWYVFIEWMKTRNCFY